MLSGNKDVHNFADLKNWLETKPGYQRGRHGPRCITGELYQSFLTAQLARPGDEHIVEAHAAQRLQSRLIEYLYEQDNSDGPIWERIALEWSIDKYPVILKYDQDGPELDQMTGQKCVKDHNWLLVKAYVRLCRGSKNNG